uniref:G-protein coupled receptors family 1 profile domain-containing protein n=4 Tax=Meloidogyne TaxID=189290 RepID=A0A914N058_MELIC
MDKLTTAKQLLFNNQTNNYLNKQEDILVVDYGVEDDDSYLNELTDEEYIDFVADFLKPTPIEWVFVVLFFILMVVGICGNCLVVYVVSRNKHMWTSMNLFLTNLALSDLLVLVFCLPPTVLNDITKTFWLSEGFCKAMLFVQNTSVYVSVLTLVAISLERWKAISKPLSIALPSKTTCQFILFIWLFAAFLSLPEPFTLKTFSAEYARKNLNTKWGTRCKESWSPSFQQKYQLIQTLVLFIAPLLVISALCVHMNIVLRQKALQQIGSRHLRERQRAMRMLIAVVLVFAISYMPVHLHNIAAAFQFDRWGSDEDEQQQQPSLILIALRKFIPRVMSYSSSVINPITYNFMSEKFRKEFRRACCCGEQRKESLNRKESMMAFRRPSSFSPANAQRHHIPLSRRCTALSQSSAAQML